jgi:hypothetical protein
MSDIEKSRLDGPTPEPERLFPDSPTLASYQSEYSPVSPNSSNAFSRSPSPVIQSRPRNKRRGASVLKGVLWSEEGARPVPKLEELHIVYDPESERLSSPASASEIRKNESNSSLEVIEVEENTVDQYSGSKNSNLQLLFAGKAYQDEWVWDGVNSRATSRTVSRRGSIDNTIEAFHKLEEPQPDMKTRKISLPPPLSLGEWKFPNNSTISISTSSPVTPGSDAPVTPITSQDVDFNALLRIKNAVSKAKDRAIKNLERVLDGDEPIRVRNWQEMDAQTESEELKLSIAKAWEEHAAEIGFTNKSFRGTKPINWRQKRNRFVPLRYSVALPKLKQIRDKAHMEAEVEEKDPDGKWRDYRKKVNNLRITKVKEIFRPAIVSRLVKGGDQKNKEVDYDFEADFEAPFRAIGIKTPDTNPSAAEMLFLMTPAEDGLRVTPGVPASKKNPFASLYRGYRTVAAFENDTLKNISESGSRKPRKSDVSNKGQSDDPDTITISRKLQLRFDAHNAVQDFLLDLWKERGAGEGQKAASVASDALAIFWNYMHETQDIKKEAPLKNERRDDKSGDVICELEQYHYVAAYLTAWSVRCERHSW